MYIITNVILRIRKDNLFLDDFLDVIAREKDGIGARWTGESEISSVMMVVEGEMSRAIDG